MRAIGYESAELMPLEVYVERNCGHQYFGYLLVNLERAMTALRALGQGGWEADRVLEVGCATGLFLDMARRAGWSVTGAEIQRAHREWARRHLELEVVRTISELGGVRYGAVVAIEVIEHVSDPLALAREISSLTRDDGLLLLSTPNRFSREFLETREQWPGLSRGAHTAIFSPTALYLLLSKAGFKSVGIFPAEGFYGDQRLIAVACRTAGVAVDRLGLFAECMPLRDAANLRFLKAYLPELAKAAPPSSALWRGALYRLCEVYNALGEHDMTIRQADELAAAMGEEAAATPTVLANLCTAKGYALLAVNRNAEAREYFARAIPAYDQLGQAMEKFAVFGDDVGKVFAISRKGIAELRLGLLNEAVKSFRQALACRAYIPWHLRLDILVNQVTAYLSGGDVLAATELLKQIPENATVPNALLARVWNEALQRQAAPPAADEGRQRGTARAARWRRLSAIAQRRV